MGDEGNGILGSDRKNLEIALEGCLGILDRFCDAKSPGFGRGGFGGGVQGSAGDRSDSLCDRG